MASGLALAIPYVLWQYFVDHWIATYTWLIPFTVGGCASYFGFAVWGARVDRARRQLLDLDGLDGLDGLDARAAAHTLPAARVVASGPVSRTAHVAPVPADPAEGPRLLK